MGEVLSRFMVAPKQRVAAVGGYDRQSAATLPPHRSIAASVARRIT